MFLLHRSVTMLPMLIAQLALHPLSFFDAKSLRHDRATLEDAGSGLITYHVTEQRVRSAQVDLPLDKLPDELTRHKADLVHIYGLPNGNRQWLRRIARPYLSSFPVPRSRIPWVRLPAPAAIVTPLAPDSLPEAVDEEYFAEVDSPPRPHGPFVIGSAGPDRKGIDVMTKATMARLGRFRDDVEWRVFETVPSPAELRDLDLWIDPALDELDFDGGTAEALCCRKTVVASRTLINQMRSDDGAAALLVPPGDPNELTHAILQGLFKPELRRLRSQRLITIGSRFERSARAERLIKLYKSILR